MFIILSQTYWSLGNIRRSEDHQEKHEKQAAKQNPTALARGVAIVLKKNGRGFDRHYLPIYYQSYLEILSVAVEFQYPTKSEHNTYLVGKTHMIWCILWFTVLALR